MESSEFKKSKSAIAQTIIWFILGWTILYNVILKEQGWGEAFLGILDTITEDMVMGSLVTVLVGSAIVFVFTVTKLYTLIISRAASFRILELIFY